MNPDGTPMDISVIPNMADFACAGVCCGRRYCLRTVSFNPGNETESAGSHPEWIGGKNGTQEMEYVVESIQGEYAYLLRIDEEEKFPEMCGHGASSATNRGRQPRLHYNYLEYTMI